jgi:dihydroorotase
MAKAFDLIIHNRTCVTPPSQAKINVSMRDSKIVAIGDRDPSSAETTFDAKGLYVLPNAIYSQLHFRKPDAEHKEDLAHGTKAAIFRMPNTNPLTIIA